MCVFQGHTTIVTIIMFLKSGVPIPTKQGKTEEYLTLQTRICGYYLWALEPARKVVIPVVHKATNREERNVT